ncbi:MAG TPA: phenylacetate--CoA ligase [Peptococcaceae bacterium]|nr:MAG: Phenylacetate--CoA ligase [Clostridia bacterium 41_269]HBT20906.1 phenylacetate--CoA ligase [Peptococcaceae bacterium]
MIANNPTFIIKKKEIWDERSECMSRRELEQIQLERLKTTLRRAYEKVPHYRKKFDEAGIKPEDIKTLKDIQKLPFTTKDDLRENYPFGMFAVPKKEIVRIHASSGTTGKPTVVGYTRKDLDTWAELVARMVYEAGARAEDMVQISFGYGLFTGALGLHYGLERIGASVVPVSSGNTERQIMLMKDFGTTTLVSTPSYALYMGEVAKEMGIDPSSLNLRLGLFGSEGWSEEMRREIEKCWNCFATDNYGLSEVMGPGVSGECRERNGMHIAEDHFLVEIIDPETQEPLDYGNKGELVITTLTREAMPLIRYRTKDITSLNPEPCRCGRTNMRMARVSGRTDDMLIIRGVNVFPSQIESVLMEIEETAPYYQIIVTREGYLDQIEIQVEVTEEVLKRDKFSELEKLEKKIKDRLYNVLSINAKVRLVEPHTIERFEGKAKRIIDKRKI